MNEYGSTSLPKAQEKRRKLDVKAEKLVFIGYEEGRKAYRFLNLETDRVTISRDAKFLELCTVKEAVRREPVATGRVIEVPLALPPENVEEAAEAPDPESDIDSEVVDINDSRYDSASDSSFHGFPLDEIARRSKRSTKGKPPSRLIEEIFVAESVPHEESEPRSLREALTCEKKKEWAAAMKDELKSHSVEQDY
nr:uncharacterized protein LOC115257608 [Aedes albopictus]